MSIKKSWGIVLVVILIIVGGWSCYCRIKMASESPKIKATWLWHTDIKNQEETIDFSLKKGVNTVYLQVNSELSLGAYANFINIMSQHSVAVYALDGGPDWGIEEVDSYFEWLNHYHNAFPQARFAGAHLNIEPYLSALWTEAEHVAVYYYQYVLSHALQLAGESGVELSADVPFWYDEIVYDNELGEGYLAEWVIEHLSSVTIMAYRNDIEWLKDITKNELQYAMNYQTPVVVGVETMHLPGGAQLSFIEQGEAVMNDALEKIAEHYADNPYLGGVSIHHLQSWMELKD